MKVSEYIRLGKISIKSRKKSTRNTVRGIAFGLIMLVPIVFFTLAFYLDLTDTINATRNVSSFYMTSFDEDSQKDGYYQNSYIIFGNNDVSALEKRVGEEVEEIVYSKNFVLGSSGYENALIINGISKQSSEFNQISSLKQLTANCNLKVIDLERSKGKLFPSGFEKDVEKTGFNIFAAGGGFSEGEKGEIIISEMLAEKYGLSADEAIGTTLTLKTASGFSRPLPQLSRGHYLDNDTNPNNPYMPSAETGYLTHNFSVDVIHEFKIVGVISSEYFKLNKHLMLDANLWISDKSVYEGSGEDRYIKYLPTLTTREGESDRGDTFEYQIVTYPKLGVAGIEELAEQAAQEKMFFPAVPAILFYGGVSAVLDTMPETPYDSLTVQCGDYDGAAKISTLLGSCYSRISGKEYSTFDSYIAFNWATESFLNFSLLHQIGGYLMIVMYTFGGIIFFATLLNLYNSVNYSVQARRNYIGMMRAIGATQKTIPRLYFVEILLIFWRSFWWVLFIGGGLSYGIKAVIDILFEQEEAVILGAKLSLNFGWFFVALVAVVAVVFLIAFLFSRVACRSVTQKGILEVLSDEK